MDRSIVLIFSIALLVLQSTQGAELNSEATLSCNGKEFKCFNTTHYQPCSLTERSGQQPQYMINGNILPCVAGKVCSDESATCCGTLTEIPVKVEITAKEDAPAEDMPIQSSPLKSLPVDEPVTVPAVPTTESVAVAAPSEEQHVDEDAKSAEPSAAPAPLNASALVDMLKTEETKPKKMFNFKGLKKVGPMRLVKGFRAATWRPKISLDSQKDVADNLRKRIYERRNKYEKFIDVVLGKATPVQSSKQPAPGQPAADTYSDSCESTDSCDDDYDECADGSCDDYEDDCGSSSSSGSGSCEEDYSDEDDDCDDEDELEPGEAEAVWEEEEVEGGIEIVEECPDDDDDDCSSDECSDEDDDYEWEDGIEETAQVAASDDDCDDDDSCSDDDSSSDCSSDDSCIDSCEDSDEECKKKRKQQQANKNKKKKKNGSKKKTDNKKTSSKKSSSKKADGPKKKTSEKKKVRYPAVQKIRKSLARSISNITETIVPAKARKGAISNAASGIQNAVLNKVDDILSIKENGGLFNKKKDPNDDTNTGCSIIEGWECPRQGRYAHPIDCQKYVQCSRQGPFNRELSNIVYECEDDEAYDPDIRSCTTDWSSCEALEQCLYHRQLIEDPSDESSYFICIRRRSGFRETYDVYRRDCTDGRVFDSDWGICVENDDYEKIKKAKKRRQQIKKQKKCQKKKGQKKKGGQKKKTPSKKY